MTPITRELLTKNGAEEYQPDVFAIYILDEGDNTRHIDLINIGNEWSFQLVQEALFEGEDVSIFGGRKIETMEEIQEIYKAISGNELVIK